MHGERGKGAMAILNISSCCLPLHALQQQQHQSPLMTLPIPRLASTYSRKTNKSSKHRPCTHTRTHARTHARTHKRTHANVSIHAQAHTCTRSHVHARTHTCTHYQQVHDTNTHLIVVYVGKVRQSPPLSVLGHFLQHTVLHVGGYVQDPRIGRCALNGSARTCPHTYNNATQGRFGTALS